MIKLQTLFLGLALSLSASMSIAADNPSADEFMCKKMRDAKLVDLKKALLEDCNLTKPFSITETDIGVNSAYTFCCTKK